VTLITACLIKKHYNKNTLLNNTFKIIMSEVKNISCKLPIEVHEKLSSRLKTLTRGRKVAVADLITAALEVPDEVLKPLIAEVLNNKTRKRTEAVGLGMKVTKLSPDALAKVQAIIDAEENNEQ